MCLKPVSFCLVLLYHIWVETRAAHVTAIHHALDIKTILHTSLNSLSFVSDSLEIKPLQCLSNWRDSCSGLGDYSMCCFIKLPFSMCLVNNRSVGTEKAITGEKSLPALTTGVQRRQVFGWVIKWLVLVSEEKSKGQRTNDWTLWRWWRRRRRRWWFLLYAKRNPPQKTTTIKKKEYFNKWHKSRAILGEMLYVWFTCSLQGSRTSLFSLETASVLSHSNLKIEMSLLGLYSCDGCYKFWPL